MDFKFEHMDYLKDNKDHNEYYLNISSLTLDLKVNDSNIFQELFNTFISYGMKLGFDINKIYNGYVKKNEKNYERLAKDY